ncbi:hypothetical protein AAFF_G00025730 [Aldrovandia affinis]|uniref:Uncharacterized protein n=1 Tax=Aldrovandia affinis TaxID=143900 RepID=A0AAD7WGB0_9TELE|nr:hypothetical protein AAFF_G00025730 [Aldrovandia affinis]
MTEGKKEKAVPLKLPAPRSSAHTSRCEKARSPSRHRALAPVLLAARRSAGVGLSDDSAMSPPLPGARGPPARFSALGQVHDTPH